MDNNEYILELKNISKIFPGVVALNRVNLSVRKGTIHAIVGENGAGKSTLMNVLSGVYPPNGGEIWLDGQKVTFSSRPDAVSKGISMVFQELSMVQSLTIGENIYANNPPMNGPFVNWKKLWADAETELKKFGLDLDPHTPLSNLSNATQQLVEITKAMASDPKVLILDEPTSSLTPVEVKLLMENMRKLKEKGCTILYISHLLSEIFEVCDYVSVLRDGQYVGDAAVKDIDQQKLVAMMVGREINDMYGKRDPAEYAEVAKREPIFSAKGLRKTGKYYNVSFDVRPGEIVGLSGLVGAGRTEVCRGIFGAEPIDGGELWLDGKKLNIRTTNDAILAGIGYMTEDRKTEGLFLEETIKFNYLSNKLNRFTKHGFIRQADVDPEIDGHIESIEVACTGREQKVGTLSGGNQQKVLVAEWLSNDPKLLIFDEPTRGIDIGAKAAIYRLIRQKAKDGIAIIVISSDLPEVMSISDRIVVMADGTTVGEVLGTEATEEKVMALASHLNVG